jgi:hypothetical protein
MKERRKWRALKYFDIIRNVVWPFCKVTVAWGRSSVSEIFTADYEEWRLHSQRCENLKSYIEQIGFIFNIILS